MLQRSPSKLAGAFNRADTGRKRADSESETVRSTEEKQALLEAPGLADRARVLLALLQINAFDDKRGNDSKAS